MVEDNLQFGKWGTIINAHGPKQGVIQQRRLLNMLLGLNALTGFEGGLTIV